MSTLDLLNAIVDKNSTEIFETFEQEMSARILDRLDDRRIEVAQSLFKMNENLDEAIKNPELAAQLQAAKAAKRSAGVAGRVTSRAGSTTRSVTRTTPGKKDYGLAGTLEKAAGLTPSKPVRTSSQKYVKSSKPAASEPESGGDKQKYVSTADKPAIEQIGGVVDLIGANAKNRDMHHEISYTTGDGEKVTRKILGRHAEIIHGFHQLMGSQDNPKLREHKVKFMKFIESAPSEKALSDFAENIDKQGILPKPGIQKESLMVEQSLPQSPEDVTDEHYNAVQRDSLMKAQASHQAMSLPFAKRNLDHPEYRSIIHDVLHKNAAGQQAHQKLAAKQPPTTLNMTQDNIKMYGTH